MLDLCDTENLFIEMEKELAGLQTATARSLLESDGDGSAALSRWLDGWAMLDSIGESSS